MKWTTWFKGLLSSVLAVQFTAAPAFAQNAPPSFTLAERQNLEANKAKIEAQGLRIVTDEATKKVYVYDKQSNELKMEIPFANEETLRKFSPKSMGQALANEMAKVKQASTAAWSHSTRHLPSESGIFFLGMGAVVAGQLITNYAQNPIAMKQHIDHQLSPLGAAGFFTFMYSQGVTSNVLSLYLKNPRYQHMIPYLGMTVGAFMQSYLSQFASDPNVQACAKSWLKKPEGAAAILESASKEDPCEKAYEYFVLKKKMWELAPGVTSMLLSAGLAAVGQSVGSKIVLRVTGFDIATFLMPGGMQVKGLRLILVKGLQITAFTAIDVWLNRHVTYVWKNIFDGAEFNDLGQQIVQNIASQKRSGWNEDKKEFTKLIKEFHKKSGDWRMVNLSEVYEAHQAWTENLQRLTGMYNASYNFYSAFLNEARSFKTNKNSPLNLVSPLNGVLAKGLGKSDQDYYHTDPLFVESMQMATAHDIADEMKQNLQGAYLGQAFSPSTINELSEIADLLSSEDKMIVGKGLEKIYRKLYRRQSSSLMENEIKPELIRIYGKLGSPFPAFAAGQGFALSFEKAPMNESSVKDVPFYRRQGPFATENITDYLLVSMLCGPEVEKKENVIYNSTGFPSIFLPPQIKKSSDNFSELCKMPSSEDGARSLYRMPIENAGQSYNGVMDYLKNNVRDNLLGKQDENLFQKWWNENTEEQMQKAFEVYAKSYEEIVMKLVRGIFREDQSVTNRGSMANGTIKSLQQEARVYQMILGEMLKDVYAQANKRHLPEAYFFGNKFQEVSFKAEKGKPSILDFFARTSEVEFESVLFAINKNTDSKVFAKKRYGYPMKVQYNFESEMTKLINLLKEIKIVNEQMTVQSSIDGFAFDTVYDKNPVIQSNLENKQIEDQLTKVQNTLKDFAKLLGVSDEKEAPSIVVLSKEQSELALLCIENLQSIATELSMYGTIANAVSWDKIRNLKERSAEEQKLQEKVQERVRKMKRIPGQ